MKTLTLILALMPGILFLPRPAWPQPAKPNIVLILADDLGNADLGYRGSDIKTPNIDKLAHEGIRLESHYGLPVCTPARAALMTGRYPMRYGLQTLVIFPSHTYGLPTDERTLPQSLREAGYYTAMVGKWHLGHADKKYWPQNRGFDYYYGNLVGEVDYFTKDRGGITDWQRNGTFLHENGYYTDLIGDEAVKIIEQTHDGKPLFLYIASLAPHSPYQAPPKYLDQYGSIQNEHRRTYAGMITALDGLVAKVTAALEKKGMLENTLIIFTSDNGGPTSGLFTTGARSREDRTQSGGIALNEKPPNSNTPFRDGKGTLHEGGVRVPAIWHWPAKLKPQVVNAPVGHVDIMPTLLAITGASGSDSHPFDGKNIWATLTEGKPSPHEEYLINVEAIRGAIRKGKWKLVVWATLPGKIELFDIVKDPSEKENLADKNPEIVHDLQSRLLAYAKEQKPSEWIKAQPQYLGSQGKTILDPDYDVDDSGLPHEKPNLPTKQK